jgi:succinate dehydrogenase / fumarate reductase, membrane anchor subunit
MVAPANRAAKRIVVGAHYGFKDWLGQRASAVIMALYTVILIVTLLYMSGGNLTWKSWGATFAMGWMKMATVLFFLSLCYHAWVGIRDIWMDYIKSTGLRLVLQVLTILWLVGCAGWAVRILW